VGDNFNCEGELKNCLRLQAITCGHTSWRGSLWSQRVIKLFVVSAIRHYTHII